MTSADAMTTTVSSSSFSSSSSSSVSSEEEDDDLYLLPLPWSVIAVVCITVAIVTAVGGNLLVLVSYGRDRQLRDVHNLYLLHLAVCDLLLGAISMPLYLIYTVLHRTWPLGVVMCKIFLTEDYTLCCMSTMIVILVAWDRLALLSHGARYQVVETRKRAYLKLTVCWIFSFLLFSPAILLWDVVRGKSVVPQDDCNVEFHDNLIFTMGTEVISFSVPFVSLAFINCLLYSALKKRHKLSQDPGSHPVERDVECCRASKVPFGKRDGEDEGNLASQSGFWYIKSKLSQLLTRKSTKSLSQNVNSVMASRSSEPSSGTRGMSSADTRLSANASTSQPQTASLSQDNGPTNESQMCSLSQAAKSTNQSQISSIQAAASPSQSQTSRHYHATELANQSHTSRSPLFLAKERPSRKVSMSSHTTRAGHVRRPDEEKRERRIALILIGLVLALVVFWLPYNITTILLAACEDCVNSDLYEAFTWLLWFKSCFNPFLYAYNSPRFRRNFCELFARVLPGTQRRVKRSLMIGSNGRVVPVSGRFSGD